MPQWSGFNWCRLVQCASLAALLMAVRPGFAEDQGSAASSAEPDQYWLVLEGGGAALMRSSMALKELRTANDYFGVEMRAHPGPPWWLGLGLKSDFMGTIHCADAAGDYCGAERTFDLMFVSMTWNPHRSPWSVATRFGRAKYEIGEEYGTRVDLRRRGWGAMTQFGYDWPREKAITRFGLRAGLEYLYITKRSGDSGSLSHLKLTVGFAVSWQF